jgi:hypothetical protein
MEGLRCVPRDVRRSVLQTAKQHFSIGSETQGENDKLNNDIECVLHLHFDFFNLAVKNKSHISRVVALETAISIVETFLTAKKISHSCLEQGVDWASGRGSRFWH